MSFNPNGLGNLRPETQALHAGQVPDPTTNARAVPIYATTSYVFDDAAHAARLFGLQEFGNIYTRIMNPTTGVFEERVAALEGGVGALGLASGQAAETLAILNITRAGQNIVSSSSLYGGTYNLFHYTLPKLGIEVRFVDGSRPGRTTPPPSTTTPALLYLETIGNPRLDVADIRGVADVAHANGLPLFVDNTFAPLIAKPLEHGADIVIHSRHQVDRRPRHRRSAAWSWTAARSTGRNAPRFKEDLVDPDPSYHGVSYAAAFGPLAFILKLRVQGLRDLGAALSPFNAWQLIQGLETLPLRIERHSENALAVAQWLQDRPEVEWVNYPGLASHASHEIAPARPSRGGFGGLVTFGIKGGADAGRKLIDSVKLFSLLANVGDAKSLVIHPASTTHQQLTDDEQASTGVTAGPHPPVRSGSSTSTTSSPTSTRPSALRPRPRPSRSPPGRRAMAPGRHARPGRHRPPGAPERPPRTPPGLPSGPGGSRPPTSGRSPSRTAPPCP